MSTKLLTRVAKLIPVTQKHKTLPSLAFVYHFEPPVDDNQELGSFMVAIEVMGKQALASQIIDQIIKTIGEKYYNEEYKAEPAERFENALSEVNKNITSLLKSKHAEITRKISAVVAIQTATEIHITRCGKASAYLYRDGDITNVTEDLDSPEGSNKLFSDIASGNLQAKDKLLLATPAVYFQFPKAQLNNLITDNSPNTAVAKMSATLAGHDNANRCGAIIVELLTHQMAAEETLPEEPEEAMAGTPTTPIEVAKDIALPASQKVIDKGKNIAKKSAHWTKNKAVPKVRDHAKKGWNHVWTNYVNPNPKLALAVASGVAIVLIGLFIFIGQSHSASKETIASFKEAVALTDSAEAKLSLGDKNTAQESLDSASAKLIQIEKIENAKSMDKAIANDDDLKSRAITFESLQAKINQLKDKVAGIIRLGGETVYDYSSNKSIELGPITLLGDSLYAVNITDGSLHQINTEGKSDQKVGTNEALKKAISSAQSYSKDAIFYLTSQPSVVQFKSGTLSDTKLSAGTWENGTDIASYTSNLYVLSPSTKQVYRHTKTGSGFGAKTSYIKSIDNANLENSTSLIVNGSVVVANKDGSINLFFNGVEKPFEVQGLPKNIKIGEIKKMIWESKAEQLYILSKDGQKITVLSVNNDSGANYVKQFAINPGSSTISSIAVNSDKGLVYAVSGKKIISFKQ